jgi:hypothetical protein
MAFDPSDLTVLAYADGYTLWHYLTDDASAETSKSGYFEPAREVFRNNDRIEVFACDDTYDAIVTTVGRIRLRRT